MNMQGGHTAPPLILTIPPGRRERGRSPHRHCKERPASPAPSSALRALTGVEPRVSTRPSDPRWGEEGIERSKPEGR
ncbi:hypothetical protein ELI48_04695 [Rhizobium ruizarguesonis]|nr:hypothetical protein ELI48_04695 [Rhizobium ruizarguesonis]TAW08786.1 hypothetical protein ELI26_03825 [Rhizobium ruizarguesonis]TAW97251.1 hypothetical protein ELI12_03910 [Rhizobium ruizarguesonis]TAZ50380.1 hypothetical protein ELH76_03895 [Rhizobium ruizarguesonis]